MQANILDTFLSLMKIRHTKTYSYQYFNEHPHKYNLYGLSSMLNDYGVENSGLKLTNKNEIYAIDCPFIAHIGNEFVIVEKINESKIHFIQGQKKISVSHEEFSKMWTGYVLLAESSNSSIEPNYKKNKYQEFVTDFQKTIIFISICFLILFSFIQNNKTFELGTLILFAINLIGLYVGYLLVAKQLNIQSEYADKLCSLFKHSDCNNIIESDAAKFLGFLGWSEVGFGYFLSNIIIIAALPSLIFSLALFNIAGVLYSFWSIWYQKYKAKQWCPLCLTVMLLLWGIFITNILFGYFNLSIITFQSLLITSAIYSIAILSTNLLVSTIGKGLNSNNIQYEINSIKADEDVFKTLLTKQPHYEVSKSTSKILLGNTDSQNLITIFSNPHCNPCAKMHKRVNDLIDREKNICVQYIFSSFGKDLDISNKYLIGVYQQKNGEAMQLFDNWFEFGKFNKEDFFNNFPVDMKQKNIEDEFAKHEQWK